MRKSSVDIQMHPRGKHRGRNGSTPATGGYKVAISMVGMRLGDRILMDAPLRLHRRNRPHDYLIAVADANDGIDLPYTMLRHFDETWTISTHDGRKWKPSPGSAPALRMRDALVANKVDIFTHPLWQPKQVPRSPHYEIQGYSCFDLCRKLSPAGYRPRYVVPRRERKWAREFLDEHVPSKFDALVAVHVRNIPSMEFKNSDLRLIRRIVKYLRGLGSVAFLMIGRDDECGRIRGDDVIPLLGRDWHFDRTAALIERAALFVGGDSGPTHAAAALGVPVIGIGYPSEKIHPFARPSRFVRFVKGESPQTIMAGVGQFIKRLHPTFGRERESCQKTVREFWGSASRVRRNATTSSRSDFVMGEKPKKQTKQSGSRP